MEIVIMVMIVFFSIASLIHRYTNQQGAHNRKILTVASIVLAFNLMACGSNNIEQSDKKSDSSMEEMIDSSGEPEEDASSEQADLTPEEKHYCIVGDCGKEASKYILGAGRRRVYYCDEHYDHLMETTEQYKRESDSNTSSRSYGKTTESSDSEEAKTAKICAHDVVENSLKDPSSAKFCAYSEMTATNLGGEQWEIKGTVSANNSLGATVEETFVVTLTLTEHGYKEAKVTFYN